MFICSSRFFIAGSVDKAEWLLPCSTEPGAAWRRWSPPTHPHRRHLDWYIFTSSFLVHFYIIIYNFLAWDIFPRLDTLNEELVIKVQTFINEVKAAGFAFPSQFLAGTLFLSNQHSMSIYENLISGIFSNDDDKVKYAIYGIFHWACYGKRKRFHDVPEDLINAWVDIITLRREPALVVALKQMAELIKIRPEVLTETHFNQMEIGLAKLIKETDLTINESGDPYNNIENEEKPLFREAASTLANAIYENYVDTNHSITAIIKLWQFIASIDTLPEVRHPWL